LTKEQVNITFRRPSCWEDHLIEIIGIMYYEMKAGMSTAGPKDFKKKKSMISFQRRKNNDMKGLKGDTS